MSGWPDNLKYYMWGFQVYYASCCETSAKSLFDHFDRGLKPHVFLLGLSGKKEPHICFEPEKLDYFLKDFKRLSNLHQHYLDIDPNKDMHYSGPGMQEEMDGRRNMEAARKAIQTIITESEFNKDGRQYFASSPVSIGNYHVFVLVGLIKEVYESHIHLSKSYLDDGRMRISKSLLESAVDVYLEDKEKAMYFPDAGKNLGSDFRATDELLRSAARKFMYTIGIKGGSISGMHGLFDNCNRISTYRYEKTPNTGHLIITRSNNPLIQFDMKLRGPFPVADLRKTRKMLELSDSTLAVISDAENVYGLGVVAEGYDAANESVFHIHFEDTYCWTVTHHEKIVLQMRYGLPEIPYEAINKMKFQSDLSRVFQGITELELVNLYQLTVASTEQPGGAMLIICKDAAEEADRLNKQCLVIEPLQLTPAAVHKLSSIDGGILLDTSGVAYAHGVILDGVVGKKGDSARGSRYNSGMTYFEYRGNEKPTCLVIVSEDGMVDIIPSLRPQIKHSEITSAIKSFESLLEQDKPEVAAFNKWMGYFNSVKFYLSEQECSKINDLRKAIETKQGTLMVRIVYSDIEKNLEMNDSYYLPE